MSFFPINIDHSFEIAIGGRYFGGWTRANVSRRLDALTGRFSIQLHDPMMLLYGNKTYLEFTSAATAGTECGIYLAGQKCLTGMIDKRSGKKNGQSHTVTVTGRGKARNVVDSDHDGAVEFRDQKASQVITKVIEPLGLKIINQTSSELVMDLYRCFRGDNAMEIVRECARKQGFVVYENADGDLVLREQEDESAGGVAQGINILDYGVDIDESKRFSSYKTLGQATPTANNRGKISNQARADHQDGGVQTPRTKVIPAEGNNDTVFVKKRGASEATRRAGAALKVQVMLYGYLSPAGKLWDINQMVDTYIPDEGIAEPLLIEGVDFQKSQQGTIAVLSLTRKEAYASKTSSGKGQGAKGQVSGGTTAPKIIVTDKAA